MGRDFTIITGASCFLTGRSPGFRNYIYRLPGMAVTFKRLPAYASGMLVNTFLRLQWRDRSGFSPDSLFSPNRGTRKVNYVICHIYHVYTSIILKHFLHPLKIFPREGSNLYNSTPKDLSLMAFYDLKLIYYF
jgi:hypothetical protein